MKARSDWTFEYLDAVALELKGADEANPEEESSNAAVIASSSIFGLTLGAYLVYKKFGKQTSDEYQRV